MKAPTVPLERMWANSVFVLPFLAIAALGGIVYNGRAPLTYTNAELDGSVDPYLTVVKGSQNASHYTNLLGSSQAPTPIWDRRHCLTSPFGSEQVLAVSVDNSSVFVPGGNPQYGFRRTDLIAQKDWSPGNLLPQMETGTTVFHFSIKADIKHPLNYNHEYQVVFIEPSDGSHVFGLQLGSPFTKPTGKLPAKGARNLKVLDHGLNVIFETPFKPESWHNFAVQVDWDQRSLAVLYSKDEALLKRVTGIVPNLSVATGPAGQGDFHFGVLKLPLVDSRDTDQNQGDVVHYGVQEGTRDGLWYSGVFVESVEAGINIGCGYRLKTIVRP